MSFRNCDAIANATLTRQAETAKRMTDNICHNNEQEQACNGELNRSVDEFGQETQPALCKDLEAFKERQRHLRSMEQEDCQYRTQISTASALLQEIEISATRCRQL